jgi:hypothetical protein
MRVLLVIGGLAVMIVGVLIGLVLSGGDEVEDASAPALTAAAPETAPGSRRYRPSAQTRRAMAMALSGKEREKEMEEAGELDEKTVVRFGQEFEKKWHEDKQKLGRERHKEMERLWFQGRRPRGNPESMEKLESILEEFPDTNRAACAAFELGHHYIRNRSIGLEDRRKKAEGYWRMVEERYPDNLCEYNAHPAALSKLAMAAWVYRYTDPSRARRVLEEVIEKHAGETDHLGQPLENTANRLLDQLK